MVAPRSLACLVIVASVLASATSHADDTAPREPLLEAPVTVPPASTLIVHVASSVDVRLEHRAIGASVWTFACGSPCDRALPIEGTYRAVFGRGVGPGEPFSLSPSQDGAVTLTVSPPSKTQEGVGNALLGVGAALAAAGVAGLVLVATRPATPCMDEAAEARGQYADGGITCGGGFGAAILGAFSVVGIVAGGGLLLSGAVVRSGAGGSTTQASTTKSSFVREATWVAPRATAPSAKHGVVFPLSISF